MYPHEHLSGLVDKSIPPRSKSMPPGPTSTLSQHPQGHTPRAGVNTLRVQVNAPGAQFNPESNTFTCIDDIVLLRYSSLPISITYTYSSAQHTHAHTHNSGGRNFRLGQRRSEDLTQPCVRTHFTYKIYHTHTSQALPSPKHIRPGLVAINMWLLW